MSRIFVFVFLTSVTAVILGAGCRTFSEDAKDEAPPVEARPSLSSECGQKEDAAQKEGTASFDDDIGKKAEREYEAGKAAEKLALEKSSSSEAKECFSQAEAHYFNALSAVPEKASYVDAWGRVALKALNAKDCEAKLLPLVKKHPGAQHLVVTYSRLLSMQRKYQQALGALQGCLEINIDSPLLGREMLLLYFESGNIAQGKEFYEWLDENQLLSPAEVLIYGAWWNASRKALADGNKDKLPKGFDFTKEQCDDIVHKAAVKASAMGETLDADDISLICGIGLFLAEVGERELHGAFIARMGAVPEIGNLIAFLLMEAETYLILDNKEKAMPPAVKLEENKRKLTDEVLFRLAGVFRKMHEAAHAARVLEELVLRQKKQNSELLDELMMQCLAAKEYDNVILSFQLYGKPTEYGRYALGFAYKEKGNYRAAYRALSAVANGEMFQNGFWLYMELSMVCQKLKMRDKVLQYAEMAWKKKPDEPMLCNFYGYTLADYGLQLELAQELIEKALKAEPRNVAYLDSLAWVLFKRGDSAKAEEIMRKLLEIGIGDNDADGEIQLHLGDILFANGKREEALRYWSDALKLTKDDDVRQELEKKLNR